ncbi:hypothetical protein LguiB_031019 [Lonicera macranthoides]
MQRIQYAKTKSDCVAKADGSYVPGEKKRKQEEKSEKRKRGDEAQQSGGANGTRADTDGGPTATFRQGKPTAQEAAAAPNNILFIQNLPHETTDTMLEVLFKQYPGFREVRMIDAKPGIAFVEFEDDIQSSVAMQALQGFKIAPQNPMVITYAKNHRVDIVQFGHLAEAGDGDFAAGIDGVGVRYEEEEEGFEGNGEAGVGISCKPVEAFEGNGGAVQKQE